jgi:hypothetical protein
MKRVKVGGVHYKINFVADPRVMGPKDCSQGWLYGLTDFRAKTITVYNDPSKAEQQITFFHELAHCIVDAYHIKNMRDEDGSHNEDAIDLLGVGLAEAFTSLGINILDKVK